MIYVTCAHSNVTIYSRQEKNRTGDLGRTRRVQRIPPELHIQLRCVATVIDDTPTRLNPGLCRNCQHAREIVSDRGSTFLMCRLSFEDSNFVKYPRLPVLACSGYLQEKEEESSPGHET